MKLWEFGVYRKGEWESLRGGDLLEVQGNWQRLDVLGEIGFEGERKLILGLAWKRKIYPGPRPHHCDIERVRHFQVAVHRKGETAEESGRSFRR